MKYNWGKIGLFAGGVLFGTAGIKILSSKDAKKVYTHTTAAALRAKDEIMAKVTTIRENAGDILADAREINEKRAADAESCIIEDCACEDVEDVADETADEAESE